MTDTVDTPVDPRTRFSFGPVWTKNVVEGNVKDHEKLLAHAVKLKVGAKSDLRKIGFETLLTKVIEALKTPEVAE